MIYVQISFLHFFFFFLDIYTLAHINNKRTLETFKPQKSQDKHWVVNRKKINDVRTNIKDYSEKYIIIKINNHHHTRDMYNVLFWP